MVFIMPEDHSNQIHLLNNLKNRLFDQYKLTQDINNLQAAISKAKRVIVAISENHPNQARQLSNPKINILF